MTLPPQAVLFDLDGTLVDSAPDLIGALQALCGELGEPPPDADAVRTVVSAGGRAMLRRGLPDFDEVAIEHHLPRFLGLYAGRIAQETRPYAGVVELLDRLERGGIAWGIVTNKPGWLARPLVEQLGWASRCAALVSGDCLPTKKPDPEPVLHACARAGVEAARTWFVGDDLRDIQAGRAAGARTFAAAWGYLDGGDPAAWQADVVVATPPELTRLIGHC
ncbi:MAG TPA: phosphoglycolate phosphatase [Dokdonella sp.]|uniref:phosphoglycolate phosphatase n=1 Tax=Dokdonella sp. TaxID=2291710 RepID=UPI002C9B9F7E|nr:phosphoglycolate phosphatase [Dokdonella sp.]HUD42125.1 phosphoglycolate phosphatase [Dokdonella sp.]